ncbi:BLUF domain-containing protein [Hoeflea ulvae]|uniref:BLUF domain-containing protein n=1 Tax=Hoeflea ulvae TaxID=2983764 RepID=A0ABT3YE44_9HYPH|nr:BLUF domain-containing protein [Hoeflea ulvae]MCY0094128.1 BLUF domain-containing protein [Hoeflea ulvae]
MFRMLYVSGASRPMGERDIDAILAVSRDNNARAGITGMLLWADGVFIQILEGETGAVRRLAARIEQDPRHRNFMVMIEQKVAARAFSDWSMGFRQLDASGAVDQSLFQVSHAALASRIFDHDGGLFLDTVLAFGRDFMAEHQASPGAARA